MWGTYSYNYLANTNLMDNLQSYYGLRNELTYRGGRVASDALFYSPENFMYGKVSFGFDDDHRLISRTVRGNSAASSDTATMTLNNDERQNKIPNKANGFIRDFTN